MWAEARRMQAGYKSGGTVDDPPAPGGPGGG